MNRDIDEKGMEARSPVIAEAEARFSNVFTDEETQGSDKNDTIKNGIGRHVDAGGGTANSGEGHCDKGKHVPTMPTLSTTG